MKLCCAHAQFNSEVCMLPMQSSLLKCFMLRRKQVGSTINLVSISLVKLHIFKDDIISIFLKMPLVLKRNYQAALDKIRLE